MDHKDQRPLQDLHRRPSKSSDKSYAHEDDIAQTFIKEKPQKDYCDYPPSKASTLTNFLAAFKRLFTKHS